MTFPHRKEDRAKLKKAQKHLERSQRRNTRQYLKQFTGKRGKR